MKSMRMVKMEKVTKVRNLSHKHESTSFQELDASLRSLGLLSGIVFFVYFQSRIGVSCKCMFCMWFERIIHGIFACFLGTSLDAPLQYPIFSLCLLRSLYNFVRCANLTAIYGRKPNKKNEVGISTRTVWKGGVKIPFSNSMERYLSDLSHGVVT